MQQQAEEDAQQQEEGGRKQPWLLSHVFIYVFMNDYIQSNIYLCSTFGLIKYFVSRYFYD